MADEPEMAALKAARKEAARRAKAGTPMPVPVLPDPIPCPITRNPECQKPWCRLNERCYLDHELTHGSIPAVMQMANRGRWGAPFATIAEFTAALEDVIMRAQGLAERDEVIAEIAGWADWVKSAGTECNRTFRNQSAGQLTD